MEIKNISERIFKTSQNRVEKAENQTNPFGVSFKGNIINADVFEKSEQSKISFGANLGNKVAAQGRLAKSAIIGSMNSMNSAFSARLDSIANFGRTIKQNVQKAWDFLNIKKIRLNFENSELSFGLVNGEKKNPISVFLGDRKFRPDVLNNLEPLELREMLEEELALGV